MHHHIKILSWQIARSRPVRQPLRYLTICLTKMGFMTNICLYRTVQRYNETLAISQTVISPAVMYNPDVCAFTSMWYGLSQATRIWYHLSPDRLFLQLINPRFVQRFEWCGNGHYITGDSDEDMPSRKNITYCRDVLQNHIQLMWQTVCGMIR